MELNEFIRETLIQISNGISEAQEALSESDCAINPTTITNPNGLSANIKNKKHAVQNISFNIALTNTANAEDKGGIGVMLGSVGIGGQKNKFEEKLSYTSVSFEIPVAFPSVDNENKPISIVGRPKPSYRY